MRRSSTTLASEAISRSTLADADESRDWRIYADFAQHLIHEARILYVKEDFGLQLTETVYALDSSTIDLCLSLFPWARFRTTKAGIKRHTLLDLRGSIPAFIMITEAKRQWMVMNGLIKIQKAEEVSPNFRQKSHQN